MSAKNYDNHNRWRNKTVAFRVSAEEDLQLETYVSMSGLTKQDYITRRLLCKDVPLQTTWGGRSPLRCPLQGETTCLPDHPQGSRHGSSPASSPHRPRFLSVTTSVLAPQRRSCCLAPVNASPAGRCSRKAYGPGE